MEQRNNKAGGKGARLVRDIAESLGKLPPQAIDMEEAVLGALMLEKNALMDVAGFLRPAHFYTEPHQKIYTAIQELYGNGDPVDMRTVVAQLRKNGKLEIIGGAFYIAELTSKVSSAANIEYHGRIIQEYHLKREFIQIASQIHHDAYEDTSDVFAILDWATAKFQEAIDNNLSGQGEKHIGVITVAAAQDMQDRMAGKSRGMLWGFDAVDRLLNGSQPGELTVLGARPGMGKTALLLQAMRNIAGRGEPCGMFSAEMPGIPLINRLACAEAELDSDAVQKGTLNLTDFNQYLHALSVLQKLPIYIDESPMLNIIDLRSRAHRLKMKYDIKWLGVDFIQMLKAGSDNKNINRDQEIGIITRTLKAIAKELGIPVIAISALGRETEKRGKGARPQLSDLRESGNIESDADVVMFLYRPEYYHITQDEHGYPTHGQCEVIVAKNRNGATDTVYLKFIGKFTKFKEWLLQKPDYTSGVKNPGTPEREPVLPFATPEPTEDTPF